MPTGIPLTNNLKNEVIACYTSYPMSISTCAKRFGLCNPTIIKILDEFKIKRHKKAMVYNPDLNEHLFNVIDAPEKAYFLGLIITDGNVFVQNNGRQASVSITLQEQDKYVLEQFLDLMRSNTHLSYDGRGVCSACVRSNVLADDLKKYGVIPRKTLSTYLPVLEPQYMSHLIRGIIDGDGSIKSQTMDNGKHGHYIAICGTHRLMFEIGNYIENVLSVKKPRVYDYSTRHLSEIKWQSINDVYTVGEWIYKDANVCLTRKYNAFVDFKNHYGLK